MSSISQTEMYFKVHTHRPTTRWLARDIEAEIEEIERVGDGLSLGRLGTMASYGKIGGSFALNPFGWDIRKELERSNPLEQGRFGSNWAYQA